MPLRAPTAESYAVILLRDIGLNAFAFPCAVACAVTCTSWARRCRGGDASVSVCAHVFVLNERKRRQRHRE